MITFTTFGTWLQGDERGYVKNGRTFPGNEALLQANKELQTQGTVILSKVQRQMVKKAIIKEAVAQKQKIYALSIRSNHVHVVAQNNHQLISNVVAYYKKASRLALKATGHNGKLWTKGYDKRFCYDMKSLEQRITYVKSHNPV